MAGSKAYLRGRRDGEQGNDLPRSSSAVNRLRSFYTDTPEEDEEDYLLGFKDGSHLFANRMNLSMLSVIITMVGDWIRKLF